MQDLRRPQEREQLEQELLEQIRAAQQTYRSTKAQTKIILEHYADLPLGHSDGNLARRQAAANEQRALEKYEQVLKLFADVVLYGRRPAADAQAHRPTVDVLTRRETEVLKLIVAGLSTKQIAVQLGINFKTTVWVSSRIMAKLDIHDVASLVLYAIRNKLVEP